MNIRGLIVIPIVLAFGGMLGCDDASSTPGTKSTQDDPSGPNMELLRAMAEADRKSSAATAPEPVIPLPEIPGWMRSEARALPAEDHGFTVGYNHSSGFAATLYQFTRGLREIPADLESVPIQMEMARAKSAIRQAVQLKIWQDAEESKDGVVTLGESSKEALWSRFKITAESEILNSDTYIWSHNNALFKLRTTGQAGVPESETKLLGELLTALGAACDSSDESQSEQP